MKPDKKEILLEHSQLMRAANIEEIICLAVLIASGKLPVDSTVYDSNIYYEKIDKDCGSCQFEKKCLACIINE